MDNPPPRNTFNYDNNLEAQHEELKRFASFKHHTKPIEDEKINDNRETTQSEIES